MQTAAAPAGEPESQNGGDERKSDILPWQLSLAVCWYNGTLKGSDGGIPAESDYSRCYQPLSPPPLWSNRKQLHLTFLQPSWVLSFPQR